jgi:hypothetical protein
MTIGTKKNEDYLNTIDNEDFGKDFILWMRSPYQ